MFPLPVLQNRLLSNETEEMDQKTNRNDSPDNFVNIFGNHLIQNSGQKHLKNLRAANKDNIQVAQRRHNCVSGTSTYVLGTFSGFSENSELAKNKAPNAAGTLGAGCTLRLPKPKHPLWKWRFLLTYLRASVYRISPPSGAHAALKVNRRVSPSTRYVYVYELFDMEFGRLATRGRTVSGL